MNRTVSPIAEVAQALAGLLTETPAAFFSDFDGTLSPVAPTPDAAEPAPGVLETLKIMVTKVATVGIVTGRGLADVKQRVNVPGMVYVGNHGLEWQDEEGHHVHPAGLAAQAALPEALREVEQRLVAHVPSEGVIFEDKVYSGSIHYRLAPDPGAVRDVLGPILNEIAEEYGFWVSDGKMVFELRPGAAINKGSAVRQMIHDRELRSAVFLGDDVTDADAFRVLHELREESGISTLAIGVLTLDTDPRVIDASDYLLDGVDDVVSMMLELEKLLPTVDGTEETR
jgi:trehalose 6-phosphate phosphatase